MNFATKANSPKEHLPFRFPSATAAEKAVDSIAEKFDGKITSYNIGKTLFVTSHKSLIMKLNIIDFIRDLGGSEASLR